MIITVPQTFDFQPELIKFFGDWKSQFNQNIARVLSFMLYRQQAHQLRKVLLEESKGVTKYEHGFFAETLSSMSEKLLISTSTLKRCIRELIKRGYLIRIKGKTARDANIYRVVFKKLCFDMKPTGYRFKPLYVQRTKTKYHFEQIYSMLFDEIQNCVTDSQPQTGSQANHNLAFGN